MKRIPASLLAALLLVLPAFPPAGAAPLDTGRPSATESSFIARAIELEAALLSLAPTLRPEPLHAALSSWDSLRARGDVTQRILTVIDYGLPSKVKRLWVFDLGSRSLLYHELVAHGRNSGEDLARSFSNDDGSFMTSLGAFVTGAAYQGRNGYSLRLRGVEPDRNDRAESRAIVVHGAPYVSEEFARKIGRLGRSHGCPALRPEIARPLIDEIKDGSLLYAWHP